VADRLLTAVSRDGRLRGRAATTSGLAQEVVRRHGAGPLAAASLVRAVSCAAVFPATWKDSERVSVQWSGRGLLGALMAEVRAGGRVRGFVKTPQGGAPSSGVRRLSLGHGLLPGGFVSVIRQNVSGAFSQSQVELASGEVDEDLEAFFAQSDQVPTRLRALCAFDDASLPVAASAVLVQALPDDDPPELISGEALEILDPSTSPETLLALALGPGHDVLAETPIAFTCMCSRDRMAAGIGLLELDELLDLINEDHGATVRCDYCGEVETFDREEVEQIMVDKVTSRREDQE